MSLKEILIFFSRSSGGLTRQLISESLANNVILSLTLPTQSSINDAVITEKKRYRNVGKRENRKILTEEKTKQN